MNASKSPLDQQDQVKPPTPTGGKAARLVSTLVVSGIFLAAGAGGIAVLQQRAAAELSARPTLPVAVATMTAAMVPGYQRVSRYVGRLEPARQTAIAFERSGLVMQVMVDEGDSVRAGDVIARMDTVQLANTRKQLEAQRRALEAQVQLAKATLGRQSRLRTKGWSPDQRFDEAQSSVAALTANIDRVSAQIAGIDIDLGKSELKAPFSGTIARRAIDEGAVVMSGAPVLNLLESSRQQARIGLPPALARTLTAGQTYTLGLGADRREARLIAKRPDLENGTRTVTTLFELTENQQAMPFGDLVTLELKTTISERGAWLPLAALKEGHRGLWSILVVDTEQDTPVVRPEAVELLYANADQAFVRGTFKDGAHVIRNGTGRIVAGQRVALAKE